MDDLPNPPCSLCGEPISIDEEDVVLAHAHTPDGECLNLIAHVECALKDDRFTAAFNATFPVQPSAPYLN